MLFIDPEDFNKSYGTIILQSLIQEDKIQYVDVNKDNQHVVKFYIKMVLKHRVDLKRQPKQRLSDFTFKISIMTFYLFVFHNHKMNVHVYSYMLNVFSLLYHGFDRFPLLATYFMLINSS